MEKRMSLAHQTSAVREKVVQLNYLSLPDSCRHSKVHSLRRRNSTKTTIMVKMLQGLNNKTVGRGLNIVLCIFFQIYVLTEHENREIKSDSWFIWISI